MQNTAVQKRLDVWYSGLKGPVTTKKQAKAVNIWHCSPQNIRDFGFFFVCLDRVAISWHHKARHRLRRCVNHRSYMC
jgi:hypothetical protein